MYQFSIGSENTVIDIIGKYLKEKKDIWIGINDLGTLY